MSALDEANAAIRKTHEDSSASAASALSIGTTVSTTVTILAIVLCAGIAYRTAKSITGPLEATVGVLVDQIGDVLEVDDDQFESPPPTLQGRGGDLISGVYKLADGLLLVVGTEALLAVASEHA